MFGRVVALRQPHWPPMHQDRPRFSVYSCRKLVADAPLAVMTESPIAATTFMSPAGMEKAESGVNVGGAWDWD